jgi:hypothetical protein
MQSMPAPQAPRPVTRLRRPSRSRAFGNDWVAPSDRRLRCSHQGDVDFAHAMMSGLFAGVRARQVADRSVG